MGNEQSNLSNNEKKFLIGVSVVGAVALTALTAGAAAPIAAKGAETVINYAASQSDNESNSNSNSKMRMGGSGVSSTSISKTNSPVWQGLKPWRGEIRTNGLSGSSRSYFTWDYTHCNIEKFSHIGNHVGSIDPISGNICKSAVPGRSIKL